MRTVTYGKHKIELFESIDEMSIKRFHNFNKYIMIDAGVGADIESVLAHLDRMTRFINKGDQENSIKELANLRQNFAFMLENTHPKFYSFVALIHSINGDIVKDLSDAKVKDVMRLLEDQKYKDLIEVVDDIKKKNDIELEVFFPALFDDSRLKQYYEHIQRRTILTLESILGKESKEDEIDKLNDYLLELGKPDVFSGKESKEISYQKNFEEMCLILSQKINVDSKNMTVVEYYTAFELLKKQVPKKK